MSNFILDKRKDISFDIPNVQIMKNDSVETRAKILTIMPEERKHLGINKSTLWYQRKKVLEGKQFRIYNKVMVKLS